MSMIDLHKTLAATDVGSLRLSEDRGKSEVTFAALDPKEPFRAGLEYTPPARGTWTIAHTPMLVPGSLEIYVCPEGCLRGVVLSAAEFDGLDRFAMITVKEKNLYDNSMEELFIEGVSDILDHKGVKPTVVFLFASCIHHMLATDLNYIHRELNKRYPDLKIVPCNMDCTMRHSKLYYEEAVNRQLYEALDPMPLNEKAVNIIGNYFALEQDSDLVKLFTENGYTVRDLPNLKTYPEYLEMAEASLNISTHPFGKLAADTLSERLGSESLYAPYCWDYASIDAALADVASAAGLPLPDLENEKTATDAVLKDTLEKLGDTEIQIDAAATPRPLELAKLLLSHGFRVTVVYADAVSDEEYAAYEWIRDNHPDTKMRAIVNFRGRVNPRDDAEKAGGNLLAIGQKAAYYSDTKHFVNLIFQSGLWGYHGIRSLCRLMTAAMETEQNVREDIQWKAWGCRG